MYKNRTAIMIMNVIARKFSLRPSSAPDGSRSELLLKQIASVLNERQAVREPQRATLDLCRSLLKSESVGSWCGVFKLEHLVQNHVKSAPLIC